MCFFGMWMGRLWDHFLDITWLWNSCLLYPLFWQWFYFFSFKLTSTILNGQVEKIHCICVSFFPHFLLYEITHIVPYFQCSDIFIRHAYSVTVAATWLPHVANSWFLILKSWRGRLQAHEKNRQIKYFDFWWKNSLFLQFNSTIEIMFLKGIPIKSSL